MNNSLHNVLKISSKSMEATQLRMRVAAENMANAKSANYVLKSVEFKNVLNKKDGIQTLEVKKIHHHADKVKQIHDPSHPMAGEDGMVTLPDIDPLIALMDVQECKQSFERASKVYETATDLNHKLIQLMRK